MNFGLSIRSENRCEYGNENIERDNNHPEPCGIRGLTQLDLCALPSGAAGLDLAYFVFCGICFWSIGHLGYNSLGLVTTETMSAIRFQDDES